MLNFKKYLKETQESDSPDPSSPFPPDNHYMASDTSLGIDHLANAHNALARYYHLKQHHLPHVQQFFENTRKQGLIFNQDKGGYLHPTTGEIVHKTEDIPQPHFDVAMKMQHFDDAYLHHLENTRHLVNRAIIGFHTDPRFADVHPVEKLHHTMGLVGADRAIAHLMRSHLIGTQSKLREPHISVGEAEQDGQKGHHMVPVSIGKKQGDPDELSMLDMHRGIRDALKNPAEGHHPDDPFVVQGPLTDIYGTKHRKINFPDGINGLRQTPSHHTQGAIEDALTILRDAAHQNVRDINADRQERERKDRDEEFD